MQVIHSGRQIERRLIIIRRTCTPAILFWEYAYYEPSNFGRFHQIFWRILLPLTEALGAAADKISTALRRGAVPLLVFTTIS